MIKIINLKDLSKKDYQKIINRSFGLNETIIPEVKKKMDEVRRIGDFVIMQKYQQRYGAEKYKNIQVTKEEIQYAYKETNKETIIALEQMIKNITFVQKAQL
ncbi:MAG: hypothetical protein AAB851_01505, partial [Patescibacteria group bacterium]